MSENADSEDELHDEAPRDVLPYASPAEFHDELWTRHGALIVGPRDAPLPPRCVKCNAPAEWRWARTLSWHPRGVHFLAFGPGILLYAIVATITRKKTRVSAALCPVHQQQRRLYRLLSIPFIAGGVGFIAFAVMLLRSSTATDSFMPTYVLAIGLVLALGGVIWLNAISRVLRVRKIEDQLVTYSGAGAKFLTSLTTN